MSVGLKKAILPGKERQDATGIFLQSKKVDRLQKLLSEIGRSVRDEARGRIAGQVLESELKPELRKFRRKSDSPSQELTAPKILIESLGSEIKVLSDLREQLVCVFQYDLASELEPLDPSIPGVWRLIRQGRFEIALAHSEQLIQAEPESRELRFLCEALRIRLGLSEGDPSDELQEILEDPFFASIEESEQADGLSDRSDPQSEHFPKVEGESNREIADEAPELESENQEQMDRPWATVLKTFETRLTSLWLAFYWVAYRWLQLTLQWVRRQLPILKTLLFKTGKDLPLMAAEGLRILLTGLRKKQVWRHYQLPIVVGLLNLLILWVGVSMLSSTPKESGEAPVRQAAVGIVPLQRLFDSGTYRDPDQLPDFLGAIQKLDGHGTPPSTLAPFLEEIDTYHRKEAYRLESEGDLERALIHYRVLADLLGKTDVQDRITVLERDLSVDSDALEKKLEVDSEREGQKRLLQDQAKRLLGKKSFFSPEGANVWTTLSQLRRLDRRDSMLQTLYARVRKEADLEGQRLAAAGQFDRAEAIFQRLSRGFPVEKGVWQLRLADLESARESEQSEKGLTPAEPEVAPVPPKEISRSELSAGLERAYALENRGKIASTLEELEAMGSLTGWERHIKGWLLFQAGSLEAAKRELELSLTKAPDRAPTLLLLGKTELALGNSSAASRHLIQAIQGGRLSQAEGVSAGQEFLRLQHTIAVARMHRSKGIAISSGDLLLTRDFVRYTAKKARNSRSLSWSILSGLRVDSKGIEVDLKLGNQYRFEFVNPQDAALARMILVTVLGFQETPSDTGASFALNRPALPIN